MATSFSYVSSSCTSRGTVLFDRTTNLRSKSNGWLEWPRREQRNMVYIHECHTSSCSSSWSRLFGESTINPKSTPEVCETVIPCDWKVDLGSGRNQWSDHNWLRTAFVEINDSTMWQSYWDYESQNLRLFRLRAMSGRYQSKPGKTKLNGSWKLAISKIWIESMESRWSSSGQYS